MHDHIVQLLEKECDGPFSRPFSTRGKAARQGVAALNQKTDMQLYYAGVDGWTNRDLASFLETQVAGGQDNMLGANAASSAESWRAPAVISYCGKVYE